MARAAQLSHRLCRCFAERHEIEGFFNLMALRANVMNGEVLRRRQFVDVPRRIRGE